MDKSEAAVIRPLTYPKPILTLVTNPTTFRTAYRMQADKVQLPIGRRFGTRNFWFSVMWEKHLPLPLVAIWWMNRGFLVQREACEWGSRPPVSQWERSHWHVRYQKFPCMWNEGGKWGWGLPTVELLQRSVSNPAEMVLSYTRVWKTTATYS